MALDRISDEIAHFIGLFHLEVEENRLRLEYDSFRRDEEEKNREKSDLPPFGVKAPFEPDDFKPGVAYMSMPEKMAGSVFQAVEMTVGDVKSPPPLANTYFDFDKEGSGATAPVVEWSVKFKRIEIAPELPPPNSIVLKIAQKNELSDNDLLLVTGETAFVDPEVLLKDFLELIGVARAASGLGEVIDALPDVPDHAAVKVLAQAVDAFTPDEARVESQLLLRGEEASGAFVNGRDAAEWAEAQDAANSEDGDELPTFFDMLPVWIAEQRAAEKAETEAKASAGADPFALVADAGPDDAKEGTWDDTDWNFDGHTVVTGANIATNEVAIKTAWLDAPVIAVAGDAISLDVISQINVMKTGATKFDGTEALPSTLINAVSLVKEGAPAAKGAGLDKSATDLPKDWIVVTVNADVMAVNHVEQHSFVSDFDRVEVSITAADTYISTGENLVFNSTMLTELGFHYDLILVDGDMVELNAIEQVHVLDDVDTVGGAMHPGVVHSAGDNLQMNRAELKKTGIDTIKELDDDYAQVFHDVGNGVKELPETIARDTRFEAKETVKALHIKGDLVKANVLKQHTHVGDSDQVNAMLADILASGDTVEIVTGSNAQLNDARVHDIGIDSDVMVGGTHYSDALIYQAKLLDVGAPPTGVGLTPLANEAVAFLVDDLHETKDAKLESAHEAKAAAQADAADLMQAMLS